jgi:hypothetical protein
MADKPIPTINDSTCDGYIMIPTMSIRWKGGKLQQAFHRPGAFRRVWLDVPEAQEDSHD